MARPRWRWAGPEWKSRYLASPQGKQIANKTLNQGLSNKIVENRITAAVLAFAEVHQNEMNFGDLVNLNNFTRNYFKGLNLMAWWRKGDFQELNTNVINNEVLKEGYRVEQAQNAIADYQSGVFSILYQGANVGLFISGAALFPDVGVGPRGVFRSATQQQIVNTANKGTTVLGSYDKITGGYVGLAKKIGANYFEIPSNIWAKMSPAEQWAANMKFLDRMITRGDNIVLSNSAYTAKSGTSFYKELQYLYSKGYRPAADGMSLIKP